MQGDSGYRTDHGDNVKRKATGTTVELREGTDKDFRSPSLPHMRGNSPILGKPLLPF
jgi:hypothetical protein